MYVGMEVWLCHKEQVQQVAITPTNKKNDSVKGVDLWKLGRSRDLILQTNDILHKPNAFFVNRRHKFAWGSLIQMDRLTQTKW